MQNRMRLLMGATALLYFGPLLAGLGGFGWAVVPVFAAIFMVWLLILRPRQFPRNLQDWKQPEAQVAFAARLFIQLLLVTVCFGIGRGVGGIAGALPPFPLMLPIAISFLAIPLARMIWDPWKADKMESFLDEAIRKIKGTPQSQAEMAEQAAYVGGMLEPVAKLPATTTEAELSAHLDALRDHVEEEAMVAHLLEQVRGGTATDASRQALAVLATGSATLERNSGAAFPTRALQALRGDAGLVALMARRLNLALTADEDFLGECPTTDLLHELLTDHPEAGDDLNALIIGIKGITAPAP